MFKPNALWVTDITQQHTQAGWVYCGVVLDAFARRVVGWSIADHCAPSWSSTPWTWHNPPNTSPRPAEHRANENRPSRCRRARRSPTRRVTEHLHGVESRARRRPPGAGVRPPRPR
ncbi:DDE-type integrase/transposase/recombinase [Micromonospora haikouensis]|uniref:DDE-type integrase/transposase/recombinase n=1 Tax=Micromonospora haikouensis TaxID=686309 RepID=UPI0009CA5086|nr:hypothetical protein BSA16_05315 [Micromonospora sp. Rc5]